MSRKPIYFDGVSPGAIDRAVTQAQRIVARFGGAVRLAALLRDAGWPISTSAIYRWTGPHQSGLIPSKYIGILQKIAWAYHVRLTDKDWSPVPKQDK